MNAALLENSPRLQSVLRVLSDGRVHSTRDIRDVADVCAVNSCVAELRNAKNGFRILCWRIRKNVWIYLLIGTNDARKRLEVITTREAA